MVLTSKEKYLNLIKNISQFEAVAIAFSGGVDSTFLCAAAYKALKKKALAITVASPLVPQKEIEMAKQMAKFIGIPHKIIELSQLDPIVLNNTPERCYHCKKIIFSKIQDEALHLGIQVLFDGSNQDDLKDYRPGMKAIKELQVLSPLQEASLTKSEIRELSKEENLLTWDLPAYACLASRIPYNSPINSQKLSMVEEGEAYLHSLGFRQIRLRHHGDIGRIEISPEEQSRILDKTLMDSISKRLKAIGFIYVCLELEGYKMGSLNSTLKK